MHSNITPAIPIILLNGQEIVGGHERLKRALLCLLFIHFAFSMVEIAWKCFPDIEYYGSRVAVILFGWTLVLIGAINMDDVFDHFSPQLGLTFSLHCLALYACFGDVVFEDLVWMTIALATHLPLSMIGTMVQKIMNQQLFKDSDQAPKMKGGQRKEENQVSIHID